VFMSKLVPFGVGDVRFSQAIDRAEHITYWGKKTRELQERLGQLHWLNIGNANTVELLAIKDFEHRVADILYWAADTLVPKGVDAASDLVRQRTGSHI
jgi:hypothetical protein